MKMGFVLLTHQDGRQVRRLVDRLNVLYDDPLIVCHHDPTQSAAPQLPGNVHFVDDPVRTRWGDWSIVEAWMRALGVFCAQPVVPEWMTLLSGADYPTAPPATVLAELEAEGADAHMEFRRVQLGDPDPWVRNRAGRYLGMRWWLGPIAPKRRVNRSIGPRGAYSTQLASPFGRGLDCYAGSMWMTLNQTAMSALLASPTTMPRLGRRYRHVFCPDESYPHSVLGNTAGVVVCPRAHRYVDWSPGHPKTLDAADVPSMAAAGAWFARKFDLESSEDLCGLVDEMVGSTT